MHGEGQFSPVLLVSSWFDERSGDIRGWFDPDLLAPTGGGTPTVTDLLSASYNVGTASSVTHSFLGNLSAALLIHTAQPITYTAAMVIPLALAAFSKVTSALTGRLSASTTTANLNRSAQSVSNSTRSTASSAAIIFTTAAITSVTNVVTMLATAAFNLVARVIDITYTSNTPPIPKWQTIRGIIRSVINSGD